MQYDEYDNAAQCMMAHSSVAWEHVQFKDVAVKVGGGGAVTGELGGGGGGC